MNARVRKSLWEQLRPFWMIIAVCLLSAAIAAYDTVTWPGFHVRWIAIRGMQVVSKDEIFNKAAINEHQNLWLQNMHAAALRIESIPYIKVARVHRSLPADLYIDVTERTPDFVVVADRESALIDADDRVLEAHGVYPDDLPRLRIHFAEPLVAGRFLKDPRIARVQRDYNVLRKNNVLVDALQFNQRTELTVQLRSGVRVELGQDGDLAAKAALVQPILHQIVGKIEKVTALDLRAPQTPVVVYK